MWEDLREFSQPIEMQNFMIKTPSRFPLTNEVDTSGLSITINYAATWWGRPPGRLLLTIRGYSGHIDIVLTSAVKRSIRSTTGFHNHGEGPY